MKNISVKPLTLVGIGILIAASSASFAQVIPQGNSFDPNAFVYDRFFVGENDLSYHSSFRTIDTRSFDGTSIESFAIKSVGISSDGRLFGSIKANPLDDFFLPAYLDLTGTLNVVSDAVGSISRLNGSYMAINNSIYANGSLLHSIDGSLMDLNSTGSALSLSTTGSYLVTKADGTIFDAAGSASSYLGASAKVFDLEDSNKLLVGTISQSAAGISGLGFLDLATMDLTSLPPIPTPETAYPENNGLRRNYSASKIASTSSGDVVASLFFTGGYQSYGIATWTYTPGGGWNKLSEAFGTYNVFTDLTDSGVLYGHGMTRTGINTGGYRMDAVPEPGTMLLLAAGAGAMIAARRRKKQA